MADPVPLVVLGPLREAQGRLVEALERSGQFLVLGRAAEATQALRMCRDRSPRCALLFADSPAEVSLLKALRGAAPLPVVVVPRTTRLGLEALAAGAVESLSPQASAEELATSLRLMASLAVVGHRPRQPERAHEPARRPVKAESRPLVLLGTSTGGPVALVELLGALPADFAVPVVIVQHMPDDYHPTFVEWLGSQVRLPVKVAEAGAQPTAGAAFVAPGGKNLVLGPGGFFVSRPTGASGPSPSVDALFESAARLSGFALCAAVLTGMGSDGARGLLALREVGAFTLAQDRATSIVFGMPMEALRLGAAELALPPAAIAEQLRQWAAGFTSAP